MTATITLIQGTVETVNVTVQDTSGVLTTLDGAPVRMTVVPYDTVAVADKSLYYAKYFINAVLNSGMMVQCLIDTSQGYSIERVEAANAPALPVTITAGSNDTWKIGSTSFVVPAGVYTTVASLAAAVQNSLASTTPLYANPYGINCVATDNGKLGLYSNYFLNTHGVYNAVQVLNGATHNALPSLGFTNAQAFSTYNVSDLTPWAIGRYSLYVSFASGSEKPFLGPITVYVTAT